MTIERHRSWNRSGPTAYAQFLADLKIRIQAAELRTALAVNRELALLYWQLGRESSIDRRGKAGALR